MADQQRELGELLRRVLSDSDLEARISYGDVCRARTTVSGAFYLTKVAERFVTAAREASLS